MENIYWLSEAKDGWLVEAPEISKEELLLVHEDLLVKWYKSEILTKAFSDSTTRTKSVIILGRIKGNYLPVTVVTLNKGVMCITIDLNDSRFKVRHIGWDIESILALLGI